VARTKELKKSPFMGRKKAKKNHHVSFGKSRLARERLFLFSAPRSLPP